MKVHIVGLGRLGMFLAKHFKYSGFEVSGIDLNLHKKFELEDSGGSWRENSEDADAVFLALFPERMTIPLLRTFPAKTLLVNLSSLQRPGLKALWEAGGENRMILSMHLMFGPVAVTASGWGGKQIVVTNSPEAVYKDIDILLTFVRRGVVVDSMSPDEHDEKMLPHAFAFLIGKLVEIGAEGADARYLTASAHHLLGLLDFTAGSEELQRLILSNPGLKGLFPKLMKVLGDLAKQYGW